MLIKNTENQKLLFHSKFIQVMIANNFIYVKEPWCNNKGVAILPYVLKDNQYYYLQIHKENNPAHEEISKISNYSTITGGLESMDFYTTVVKEMWEEVGIDISGTDVLIHRFIEGFANKSSNKKWFLYAIDLTNLNLDINKIYYGKGGDGTNFEKGIHAKFVTNESLMNSNDFLSICIKGKLVIKNETNTFHFNYFNRKIEINEQIFLNEKQQLKNFFDHTNLNDSFIQNEKDKYYVDNEPLSCLLHYAVDMGYFEIAELLLAKGADVNLKDINGCTPLQIAVANPDNNIQIVKLLLENGADVNVQNKNGSTVLDYAFKNNRIEIIKEILKDYNLNDYNKNKYIDILLIYFLKYNDIKSFDWLNKNFNIDYDIEDNEGFTSLHYAVKNNNLDIIKFLIEKNVDINAQNDFCFTSLHYAVKNNNLDIIKFLIEKNVDINAQNDFCFTSLHYAVKNNNLDIIKFLIEKNVDINAQNDFCFTSLHYAVDRGYFEIAELLLAKGADVNLKDINGCTPLQIAVANPDNDVKMIKLLLDNNSDINAQDEEGFTILHYAVDNGDLEMVKFLIDYNFNLNDDIFLFDELFKVLIKRFKNGANVNIKNIYGDTPLHYAVDMGYFEIAELLIKNGANINAQDKEGFTPLYSAIDNNDFKIVELLIKNYVNVQIQFNNGNTALDYAKENNNLQIINLLYKKYKLPTLNNNKRKSVKNQLTNFKKTKLSEFIFDKQEINSTDLQVQSSTNGYTSLRMDGAT